MEHFPLPEGIILIDCRGCADPQDVDSLITTYADPWWDKFKRVNNPGSGTYNIKLNDKTWTMREDLTKLKKLLDKIVV